MGATIQHGEMPALAGVVIAAMEVGGVAMVSPAGAAGAAGDGRTVTVP
jgi:hypothetical protein